MDLPLTPVRLSSEFVGTFVLVFAGCGAAVLAANDPAGIGALGVALAFGLAVLVMAYAVGHVSGAHFNPAVTVGLAVARRFAWRDVPLYVVTQVVAAIAAATVLLVVAQGRDGFDPQAQGFAANGYEAHSLGNYSLLSALVVEVLLTAVFVWVVLGATDGRAPHGFAPLAIGLALTLIHLVAIPVTGTSVNPARSTGPALFAGGWALEQLWVFWVAPLIGAAVAGATYALITGERNPQPVEGDIGP